MSAIQDILNRIATAVLGIDVRDAIHDGIAQCYNDTAAGATLADAAATNADTKAALANQKAALADAAATAANTKAALADAAATLANTKAGLADAAAAVANTAAAAANTKAALADDKAELADAAATDANAAATLANTKATLANTAASNADTKAALANTKASLAENAATLANTKAALADDKATAANNAAVSAGNAASLANAKAALADEKAALANTAAANADTKAALAATKAGVANEAAVAADTAAATASTSAANADTKAALAETKAGVANAAAAAANAAATAAATAASECQSDENARTAAEALRQTNTATAIANCNAATAAANTAASRITGMTVEAEELSPEDAPTVALDEVGGHIHLTYGLPRGMQGEQGPGYTILGAAFETLGDLETTIFGQKVGDQYNVGTAPPYDIYRWTGENWENQGALTAMDVVKYNPQALTAAQQKTVRDNIGAGKVLWSGEGAAPGATVQLDAAYDQYAILALRVGGHILFIDRTMTPSAGYFDTGWISTDSNKAVHRTYRVEVTLTAGALKLVEISLLGHTPSGSHLAKYASGLTMNAVYGVF